MADSLHPHPFQFDIDTAATHVSGEGTHQQWATTLGDRWSIGDKPNGGYVLAAVGRVLGQAIARSGAPQHEHPLTITAHYLRPSEPGPAQLDVEILRTGRTFTSAHTTFVQGGKARLHVLATFGHVDDQNGPSHQVGEPPVLPAPEDCVSRSDSDGFPPASSMGTQVEVLLHPDTGWVSGKRTDQAETRAWIRFADGRPADALALLFFSDALPPSVFEVLPDRSWVPTIELTVHVRSLPAPGWLRAVTRTRHLVDGRFEEDGELWDSEGRLVALSRQLGMVLNAG